MNPDREAPPEPIEIEILGHRVRLDLTYDDYCWVTADGRMVVFNVTRAMAIGHDKGLLYEIHVPEIADSPAAWAALYRGLDTAHAMTTDLNEPCCAAFFEGAWLMIDGSHRVYRALTEGVEDLSCYMLEDPIDVTAVIAGIYPPEVAAAMLALEAKGTRLREQHQKGAPDAPLP